MTESPLICIVIPTYQAGGTLQKALSSITQQTFQDLEVLIMDGGSSDDTIRIAETFAMQFPFIKVFSERDAGIYDAMNKGIKVTQANWLYFMGADDTLFNERVLEKNAVTLQQSEAEIVYGNVRIVNDSSWAKNGDIYDGEFDVEKLFSKNIPHQAIFYSLNLFRRLGPYNPDYKICADWDFNHRCFATSKTKYVNEIIANFTGGGESTTTSRDKFTTEDFVVNLKRYYGISYTHKLFSNHSLTFARKAKSAFSTHQFYSGLNFLKAALYHSRARLALIKYILQSG